MEYARKNFKSASAAKTDDDVVRAIHDTTMKAHSFPLINLLVKGSEAWKQVHDETTPT